MQTLIMQETDGRMEYKIMLNDDGEVTQCVITYKEPKPLIELINLHAVTSPGKVHYGTIPPAVPNGILERR
jgi:hypothetical protein